MSQSSPNALGCTKFIGAKIRISHRIFIYYDIFNTQSRLYYLYLHKALSFIGHHYFDFSTSKYAFIIIIFELLFSEIMSEKEVDDKIVFPHDDILIKFYIEWPKKYSCI